MLIISHDCSGEWLADCSEEGKMIPIWLIIVGSEKCWLFDWLYREMICTVGTVGLISEGSDIPVCNTVYRIDCSGSDSNLIFNWLHHGVNAVFCKGDILMLIILFIAAGSHTVAVYYLILIAKGSDWLQYGKIVVYFLIDCSRVWMLYIIWLTEAGSDHCIAFY